MDAGLIVLGIVAIVAIIFAVRQYQRADGANLRAGRLLKESGVQREKLESLREEVSGLKKERERLSTNVTKVKKKSRGDERRTGNVAAERDKLKSEAKSLADKLASRDEVVTELRERMDALESELAQALGASPRRKAPVVMAKPVEAVVEAPTAADAPAEGDDTPAEGDEAAVVPNANPELDLKVQAQQRKIQSLESHQSKYDERLERSESRSKVANDRFREMLKTFESDQRKLRRSLRQEADHREMVRVLKDKLEAAQELLLNLEVKFGAKVPDEITGELKRRQMAELLEEEEKAEPKGRRGQGRHGKSGPPSDRKPVETSAVIESSPTDEAPAQADEAPAAMEAVQEITPAATEPASSDDSARVVADVPEVTETPAPSEAVSEDSKKSEG